jgi:hypothetical protein
MRTTGGLQATDPHGVAAQVIASACCQGFWHMDGVTGLP